MSPNKTSQSITASYDPWEAYLDIEEHGKMTLSNIEFTTTTLCNMRCEHCAVGYTLSQKDPETLPMELILRRLEEIPHLRTLSITGGEPMMSKKSVEQTVVPLLKYAHERGVKTQINSNLTLPYERYVPILPYIDVIHISHNWGTVEEFIETGFKRMDRKPPEKVRKGYLKKMIENAKRISAEGVLISAETMLNRKTFPYLEQIHKEVVEMGCFRHEVHPMYPVDFAANLETLSLAEMKEAINRLLACREEKTWMLFGTLPFYPCSSEEVDLAFLDRLYREDNVTVRNDPDGRSRLNVNVFNGEIIVTDFGDEPSLGNIQTKSLPDAYEEWLSRDTAKSLNCHCPAVKCLGPNILVKNTYYKEVNFQERKAKIKG